MDKLPFIKVLAFNAEKKQILSSINADTNIIIRNSNVVKNPDEMYNKLADIEDRANAVYNMLLIKEKQIPHFAPDLYTQTIKYSKK